jgi:cell shape-determining protein MreC
MKAFFLTILIIIIIPFIIYRIYILITILSKQKKFGKSRELTEWLINNNPIERFFTYGTFKKIEIEKNDYKILKEDREEDLPNGRVEN